MDQAGTSPVCPLPAGQFGPSCPWWLFVKQCVPETYIVKRWQNEGERGPCAAVGVPGRLLEEWDEEARECGRNSSRILERLNMLLLSWDIPVRVLEDCQALAGEIFSISSRATRSIAQSKGGHNREKNRKKMFKIHIRHSYIVNPHATHQALQDLQECHDSFRASAEKLLEELQQEVNEKGTTVEAEKNTNAQLKQHIDGLFRRESAFHGKPIQNCQERASRYKLSALKNRAQLALAIGRQIGLDVDSLVLRDCQTGQLSQLSLSPQASSVGLSASTSIYCSKSVEEAAAPSSHRLDTSLSHHPEQGPADNTKKFAELPVPEKAKIYRLLQVLDRFCVSDAAYHEVTMNFPDLPMPKSYLVKQSRANLNRLTTLNVIEGAGVGQENTEIGGARISLKEALALEISLYLSEHPDEGQQKMRVKLAGDGAVMTRQTSFQLFSFSLLNWGQDVLSPSRVRTIAVVAGQESYETLRDGMKDVFQEVNDMVEEKKIDVDGKTIELDFYLCGDMKFKQKVLGLQGATANYACIRCKVEKEERYVVDEKFNRPPYLRTIDELRDGPCEKGKIKPPLIIIPIDHVVSDELHLFLRVTDVLTRNVVLELLQWDVLEVGTTKAESGQGPHMQKLVQAMKEIGISFAVWPSRKAGQDLDFTSLMGPAKRKMIEKLPEKFDAILRPETCAEVKWLWVEFSRLFEFISSWKPALEDLTDFGVRVKEWVSRFCVLGDRRLGYQKVNVTPYMHDFASHAAYVLSHLPEKSLKPYSCTSIEKKNDFARVVTQRHSNNHNAALDVLLACERQAYLEPFQRQPRHYNQTDASTESEGVTRLKKCPNKPAIPELSSRLDPRALAAQATARAAAAAAFVTASRLVTLNESRRRAHSPDPGAHHSQGKRKKLLCFVFILFCFVELLFCCSQSGKTKGGHVYMFSESTF